MFYNATEILLFHDAIGKGNVLKYDDTENYFGGGKKNNNKMTNKKVFSQELPREVLYHSKLITSVFSY